MLLVMKLLWINTLASRTTLELMVWPCRNKRENSVRVHHRELSFGGHLEGILLWQKVIHHQNGFDLLALMFEFMRTPSTVT